jgi:hypothetical protein
MRARVIWNECVLVIESETVRREAVGWIAWLGDIGWLFQRAAVSVNDSVAGVENAIPKIMDNAFEPDVSLP